MENFCAVCAEPLEWVSYGPCGHKEACSKCSARLRFVLNDKRCVICQVEHEAVFTTRSLGDFTDTLSPERFQQLKVEACCNLAAISLTLPAQPEARFLQQRCLQHTSSAVLCRLTGRHIACGTFLLLRSTLMMKPTTETSGISSMHVLLHAIPSNNYVEMYC